MEDYENTGSAVREEDDSDNYYEQVSLHEDIGDARYVSDTSRKPLGQNKPNDENPNVNWKERQKKGEIENKSNVKERLQERQTDENLIITSQRKNKSTKWKILFGISLIICTGLASGHLYVIVKELSATVCTREHCLNGGQCFISEDDYRCACPRGFYGPRCKSTPCSDQPCLNNGACTVWQHTFNCSCLEGFDGTQCEDTPCTRGHCLNGGQCFISEDGYRCTCPRGFYGPKCEILLKPPPVRCVTLCEGITNSGVYRINPDGSDKSITVYCENEIDGGGWTVIQRRVNGSVDFYRGWDEYVSRFGNASGEFWLGLENIHRLTLNGLNELRLDFEDWSGVKKYSKYTTFSVDDFASDYTLSVSGYTGSAPDAMQYHNRMKFSTNDNENDKSSSWNCVIESSGGWWYNACHHINLNGLYKRGNTGTSDFNVVSLKNWHGDHYSLKRVSMMIR